MEWAALGAIDFGIEKKFRNSNLRLSYTDMLGQNKWHAKAHVPDEDIDSGFSFDLETTIVSITYTLNFGNSKLRSKQARKTASTEEQSRLR